MGWLGTYSTERTTSLRVSTATLGDWLRHRDREVQEIAGLAPQTAGQEGESTAHNKGAPCFKTGPPPQPKGSCCDQTLGEPSLDPAVQGDHVQGSGLESGQGMGTVVPPVAKGWKKGQQEEGGRSKGQASGWRTQPIRSFPRWTILFSCFLIGASGNELFQGVCELHEGDETGIAGEPSKASSQRRERNYQGAATSSQPTQEHPQQDLQQATCFGTRQRKMECMADLCEGGDPETENKVRGNPNSTHERDRGTSGGRKEDWSDGFSHHGGRGRRARCRRISGRAHPGQGRDNGEPEVEGIAGTDGTKVSIADPGRKREDATTLLRAVQASNGTALRSIPSFGRSGATEERPRTHRGHGRTGWQWSSEGHCQECCSSLWGAKGAKDSKCLLTIWTEGKGEGERGEQRESQDGRLHAATGHGAEVRSTTKKFGQQQLGGTVHQDQGDAGNCREMLELTSRLLMEILHNERFLLFILFVATDFLIFAAVILYIICSAGVHCKTALMVQGHRYFRRERSRAGSCKAKGKSIIFILLLCQQHGSSGLPTGQGQESEALADHRRDYNFEQSGYQWVMENFDHGDLNSLMTRQETSGDQRAMPTMNRRDSPERDFDEAERSEVVDEDLSDGDHYQMAIIFQREGTPISLRLFWDEYWVMHRQISRACGISIDDLIGTHHVRHPPFDIEELETQAIIAQKSHEVFHGEGVVLVLVDVELHAVEPMIPAKTRRSVEKLVRYASRKGILRTLGLEQRCLERKKSCLVWKNNKIWKIQAEDIKELGHGDYVRVAIPRGQECSEYEEALKDDPMEGISLVQLHVSTQTDNSATPHTAMDIEVYGLGQDYILLDEVEPNIRNVLVALEETWDIQEEEVRALYEVHEPPIRRQRYGVGVFLLEKIEDSRFKARDDDVFMLVEVIIKGHQLSRDSISKFLVTWMRRRARRLQVLSQLRIDGLCDSEETFECTVYYNNIRWPEADYAIRHFLDGDSVWIEIIMDTTSARSAFQMLVDVENSETNKRLYGERSQPQPDEEPSETEATSSRIHHRNRSRSRTQDCNPVYGTVGALGSVEDASRDPESCNWTNLTRDRGRLQEQVVGLPEYKANISNFDRLPPPGNTPEERSGRVIEVFDIGDEDDEGNSVMEVYDIGDEDEEYEGDAMRSFSMRPLEDRKDIFRLFQEWPEQTMSREIHIDENLSPISLQFLSDCVIGWDDEIKELHIYTDGSYSRNYEVASFAFAVFGWSNISKDKNYFIGWYGGIVSLDAEDPNYVGAHIHSAGDGETSALTWTMIWILQSSQWIKTVIHFDSTTAGFAASGDWHFDEKNNHKKRLRELVQLAEVVRPDMIVFQHVKAHSSHPCNDLVDGLAKQTIGNGRNPNKDLPDWRPLFSEGTNQLTWAWWTLKGLHPDMGTPKMTEGTYRWNKPKVVTGLGEIKRIEIKEDTIPKPQEVAIRMCTYNVLTLRDKETPEGQRGEDWKAAFLRGQFADRGYHIVGLQETRASGSTVIRTPDYVRFISSGENGHHGCELWIHGGLSIGYKNDSPITLKPNQCCVVYSDPRILGVTIKAETTTLVIFVVHVPHEGTEETTRNAWWEHLEHILQRFKNVGTTILLGDLNARFGEEITGRIGPLLCPKTTKNGTSCLRILEVMDGWIPCTFPDCHEGPGWTWTHPRGPKSRIDYVIVENNGNITDCSSWTEFDIQSSLTVRDHEAAAVEIRLQLPCQIKINRKARAYDWDALHSPEGRQRFQQMVKSIPEVQWDVDVHTHWQRIEDGLHNGLAELFPNQKKKGQNPVFSQHTWTMLDKRKKAKKILDHCDLLLDEQDEIATIKAWRYSTTLREAMETRKLYRLTILLCHLQGLTRFREVSKSLRIGIKQDKANFVEKVVDKAASAHGTDIFKELRPLRIGGKFRKRGPNTLPGFILEGEQATDHLHHEALWLRHCSRLEAGVITSTNRLLQRARKGAGERIDQLQEPFRLDQAPSLAALEAAFRHVKKNKAGGIDGFMSDICAAAPRELAQKYFPIMLKTMAQLEEPLQMKGGVLVYAFKGGSQTNPEDFRSLLLSSHPGKAVRRAIRKQYISAYSESTPDCFFSIRAGGNVSHASQTLRLFCSAARGGGASVGVLFLDVKAAYYRIIRQLVVEGRGTESITRVMRYFELGATELQDLLAEINETPEGQTSNLTQHQELLLEELLSSTWFTAQHRSEVLESLAGSRPGDGLADLVFGFVFKRIMRRIRGRLEESLDFNQVAIGGRFDFTKPAPMEWEAPVMQEVIWADDLAIAYRKKGATSLVEDMGKITMVVFQECLRHGLIPNLKRGKTELLLLLHGEGSRSARAQYFNDQEPKLNIQDVPEDFGWINIVHTYRHLGTKMHVSQKVLPEIKARCGQAGAVFRKHKKQIFQNPRISMERRVYLFNSMVMAIMEYNIGTWSKLSKGEWSYFNKRVLNMYRGIARATIKEEDLRMWSHDKLLAYLQLPKPEAIVHVSRLRYLISVYNSGPETLWHLIGVEKKWLAEVQESLYWMECNLKGYGPDQSGHEWRPAWSSWFENGGRAGKSWIRKAKDHAILEHSKQVEWKEFHFDFLQQCLETGWDHAFPWPNGEDYERQEDLDACLACNLVFKNRAAWSVHAFRIHDRRNPCRRVIGGSRCDACSREYRSTARLLTHLRYSQSCYRRLVQAGMTFTEEEILPGIGSRQEQKSSQLPIPVMRSEGPLPQRLQEDVLPPEPDFDFDTVETILDCFLDMPANTSIEDGLLRIKQCFSNSTVGFKKLRNTVKYLREELQKQEMHLDWQISPERVNLLMELTLRRFRISWFFTPEQTRAPVGDQDLRDSAWDFCRREKGPWRWKEKQYVPRFGSHILIWLHFCSGERRAEDVQAYLETLRVPSGYILRILSVDVIYDPIAGNLACPVNQAKWLGHIDSGHVIGFLAGPPCESWSRARLHGGLAGWSYGDGGPRTLRTLEFPQGLSAMRVAEQRQVLLGNRLLCFIMMAFIHMLRLSRFAMVEHPATSKLASESWLASIWRLFMTEILSANTSVKKIEIFQGLFGAISPKPTCLLFSVGEGINVEAILKACQTVEVLPRSLEMGFDSSKGEFNTASLKNYPGSLCRGISTVCQRWLDEYLPTIPPDGSDPLGFSAFVQFTEKLDQQFNYAAQRGADFHR